MRTYTPATKPIRFTVETVCEIVLHDGTPEREYIEDNDKYYFVGSYQQMEAHFHELIISRCLVLITVWNESGRKVLEYHNAYNGVQEQEDEKSE